MFGGKILKKFVTVGIFISLIFSLTGASCFNNGNNSNTQQITLTVWRLYDDQAVFDPIIRNYQTTHPNIRINYVKMDINEYELKTSEALAAGNGPDIWMIRNDWMPRHNDKLVPLPDKTLSKNDKNKSDIDIYN
jgi:ABC-type glycerol-3-phosphate transport system substrate-binding protein